MPYEVKEESATVKANFAGVKLRGYKRQKKFPDGKWKVTRRSMEKQAGPQVPEGWFRMKRCVHQVFSGRALNLMAVGPPASVVTAISEPV